mgnify:CR=1 FL=1
MNDLNLQLESLGEMLKVKDVLNNDCFLLFKDHVGWTNGVIADLTDLNTENVKAKAK